MLLVAAASCEQPLAPKTLTDTSVLLRVPHAVLFQIAASPDGAVFATGSDGLYRSFRSDLHSWTRVAVPGDFVTQLWVVSRDTLFAIGRAWGAVYRWDSAGGWRTASDQCAGSAGPSASCLPLFGLWGRSARDVYAVGNDATILHYDGVEWNLEQTPVTAAADSNTGSADFWAVSGTGTRTFAGGQYTLLQKTGDGPWSSVNIANVVPACGVEAVATERDRALFATASCVAELDDSGTATILDPGALDLGLGIYGGSRQSDGTAVLWGYSGTGARVSAGKVYPFRVPNIDAVGAIIAFGDSLIVAGTAGDDGVIVLAKE